MTQPPLFLVDNFLDTVALYPSATLSASSELAGREARRVADYRRDRTWWQPSSAGDRPHLDATDNPLGGAAGTYGRFLKGSGTSPITGTSHTLCFLFNSSAALTGTQTLGYFNGAPTLACFRSGPFNRLGFWDGSAKDFGAGAVAPTDGAWHTLIYVFDGATSLAKVYVDGVQLGTAGGTAYVPITPAGAVWGFLGNMTAYAECCPGRLGRVFYYAAAQNAGAVATIHTALMSEIRDVTNVALNTAQRVWDPLIGQGGQLLRDVNLVGNAARDCTLGDSTAVEWNSATNDANDPFWRGGAWLNITFPSAVRPDYLFLDRGHNLWGTQVVLEGYSANMAGGSLEPANHTDRSFGARTIPALNADGSFPVGGDPLTGFAVTEEGACYTLYTPGSMPTSLSWRVRFLTSALTGTGSFAPIVTGAMPGARTQLATYSGTRDEDAGGRAVTSGQSDAGYVATGRVASWRECAIDLKLIGATEYDGMIRRLRELLFRRNQPAVVAMNWGTHPERAWMYQFDGARWSAGMRTAYRETRIPLRETQPLLEWGR